MRNAARRNGIPSIEILDNEPHDVLYFSEELAYALGRRWKRLKILRKAAKYLGAMLLLLAVAGVWWYVLSGEPDHPPATVENMLVKLGFQSPPQPLFVGNPDVKVWIDIHTALYYCFGDVRFGKTVKGKVVAQHDAQEDHFQPALGKACE